MPWVRPRNVSLILETFPMPFPRSILSVSGRNPHYLRAFQFVATNKIDGYVPPGYNKLRTTLLQKENDNVHRQLEPLRSTWKEKGVTIVSKDVGCEWRCF
ncbi:hypothetical protein Tco_1334251 [Tanacetum coccineum]